ncbi:MAG: NTP transferase domain-containing protein [Candidatus Kapabacteria bacterium]|nr:NTP transferase domain-containing protein [Candidatus Kapabacteria bacterium]
MIHTKQISSIILAAGLSERMLYPKPLLNYNENILFIEKIISEYQNFNCDEIIIVLNHTVLDKLSQRDRWKAIYNDNRVKIAINKYPENGRFGSIKIGVAALKENNYCFIQNCDNPFVNRGILQMLSNSAAEADYIVPVYQGRGGHPALINSKIISKIMTHSEDDLDFRLLLAEFKKKNIEFDDDSILININNNNEYKKYFNQ